MDLQELINKARGYKQEGKIANAVSCYQAVLDHLVAESAEYARSQPDSYFDVKETRRFTPRYFEYADYYLRQNNIYCRVSNNVGVIFAELGDFENARKSFQESIKYIPEGELYLDPETNLSNLK